MLKRWFAGILVTAAVSGCGSQGQSDNLNGVAPVTQLPAATVVGKVYLGADIEGARLQIQAPDGTVLATGTTNHNGMVFFENLSVPSTIHAVATVPGSEIQFSTDLQNFNPREQQVHISVLSTLASEVRQANSGLSQDQAESKVKRALALPDGLHLNMSFREPNAAFSSFAFFRRAAQNGGWSAYRQRVLRPAGAGRS